MREEVQNTSYNEVNHVVNIYQTRLEKSLPE